MTTGRINQVIRESAAQRAHAPTPRFAPTGARGETNPLEDLTENRDEKAQAAGRPRPLHERVP